MIFKYQHRKNYNILKNDFKKNIIQSNLFWFYYLKLKQ